MKKQTPYALDLIAREGLENIDMSLRLYDNNVTPADDGSFGMGTFDECTAAGYAAEDLLGGAWSFIDGGLRDGYPIINATQPEIDFALTDSDPQMIYGWYTVYNDGVDDHVMWAERLVPTADIPSGTGTISINPLHVFGVEEE